MSERINKLVHFWFEPIDPIRLQAFRVCLGVSILLYIDFRWEHAAEWLTSQGFHISAAHLPYHDLWLPLIPASWLSVFGYCFYGIMILFIAGWQLKVFSWALLGCLFYVTVVDQTAAFSPNKLMIVSVFVIAVMSLVEEKRQSAWAVRVLQATLIIHLFMSGWTKIVFGEWGANPWVLYTQIQGTYRTDLAAYLLSILPVWCWALMQYSALAFELFSPILFMRKHFRWIAFIWGGIFQIMIALTMQHLVYFNLLILSFFILFVSEKRLHWLKSIIKR